MNIRDWKLLNALYKYKNITKAAQHTFISQPALTARIKQIENYYGTQLIIRGRRGIKFTQEGEFLATYSDRIIDQDEYLKEHIINMKDNFTGVLNLGASNYIAKYKLPRILKLFKEMYPNMECNVFVGLSGEIYRKIQDREIDIAFIRGDYPWRGERHILFEENLCAAYTKEFSWEDLPQMPLVEYVSDPKLEMMIEDWWNSHYDRSPHITLHVDQVDTCKEMVINGLGYGIIPSLIIQDHPEIYSKNLTINGTPIVRKTWLYYHSEDLEVSKIKIFVDFIRELNVKGL